MKTENRIFLPVRGQQQQQQTNASGVDIPDVIKVAARPNRCSRFIARFLPACAILSIVGGTTFMGLSLVVIAEGSVGVSDVKNATMEPGVYLQLPWKRDRVEVVSVEGLQTVILWNVVGMTIDDMPFDVRSVTVQYEVTNAKRYVDRVREARSVAAFNAQLSGRLVQIVTDELEAKHSNDIDDDTDDGEPRSFHQQNIEVESYGITIATYVLNSTSFPRPTPPPHAAKAIVAVTTTLPLTTQSTTTVADVKVRRRPQLPDRNPANYLPTNHRIVNRTSVQQVGDDAIERSE